MEKMSATGGKLGGSWGGDGAECRERHNCVYRGAYFTRVLCRGRERILRNGRLSSNGVVVDYCTYTERCKYVHIHKGMCMCMCMCVYGYVYIGIHKRCKREQKGTVGPCCAAQKRLVWDEPHAFPMGNKTII